MVLRKLAVSPPLGFWVLAASILLATFPVFFIFVSAKIFSAEKVVRRVVLATVLSIATYFVSISAAFLSMALIWGE
jgi:hypothetical protein